jgi:uncharacterized protein YjiS (DUF1127 family)
MISGRARLSRARTVAFSVPKSMMEKAMPAWTQSRRGEAPAFLGSLVERLAAFAARFARAASQRRALCELARLDDRMLKDIGLFRGDVDAAESLPLGRDPIALLASKRTTRRNARSANRCC